MKQSNNQIQKQEEVTADNDLDVTDLIYQGQGVEATDLPFDFKREDVTWKDKYGITSVPLLVRSVAGKLYDDKRLKGVFVDGKYKRIVGRNYVVFPNEEVEEILQEYIRRTNEGLEIKEKHTSHFGDAAYWVVLSPKLENVRKDDDVQIGCVVRNSVGTYVALGADLFTNRLVCENGAVAKGSDLGSIAIRHLGHREDMLSAFSEGIEHIIDRTAGLAYYYRKANVMKVTQRIAEEWAKRIPQRALPKSVEVDEKTHKVTLLKEPNLWEAFNEITKEGWHNGKTGFLTKNHLLQHAHKVLIYAVEGMYN